MLIRPFDFPVIWSEGCECCSPEPACAWCQVRAESVLGALGCDGFPGSSVQTDSVCVCGDKCVSAWTKIGIFLKTLNVLQSSQLLHFIVAVVAECAQLPVCFLLSYNRRVRVANRGNVPNLCWDRSVCAQVCGYLRSFDSKQTLTISLPLQVSVKVTGMFGLSKITKVKWLGELLECFLKYLSDTAHGNSRQWHVGGFVCLDLTLIQTETPSLGKALR